MMNRDIRKEATDLNAASFEDAMIWLPQLVQARMRAGDQVIRGRTFRNCLLAGPAVFLAVSGVQFDGCNFGWGGGDMKGLLLRPVSDEKVVGAVPFQDCSFIDCEFVNVGYTGPEKFIEAMLAVRTKDAP